MMAEPLLSMRNMNRRAPSFAKASGLLGLMLVAQCAQGASIYDGDLRLQLTGCPLTEGRIGPISANCSSALANGQAFADYSHLGVEAAVGSISSYRSQAEIFDTLTVAGIAVGTQVVLTFVTQYDGLYSFSATDASSVANISTTALLYFNQVNLITGGQSLQLCGIDHLGLDSCYGYGSYLAGAAPAVQLQSAGIIASAGTGFPFQVVFDLTVDTSMGASASGDFIDPFSLTNILVTDPSTGLPVAGATVIGASGTSYPVNLSPVPEPTTVGTIAGSILLIGLCRRYGIR